MIDLPEGWTLCILPGVDIRLAGIYEWRIPGNGSCIGETKHFTRRLEGEYLNNLQKLLTGRPYRKRKPDGFRYIHHEMAWAHHEQRLIELIILENIEGKKMRCERERQLTRERGTLNGPVPDHRRFRPRQELTE